MDDTTVEAGGGGSPESLKRHLNWLYGKGGVWGGDGRMKCRCEHAWVSGGRLYGISMGKSWARTTTHPYCPFHGTKAEAERKARQKAKR